MNPQKTADSVTFTEEILNGKLNFLCSGYSSPQVTVFHNFSEVVNFFGTILGIRYQQRIAMKQLETPLKRRKFEFSKFLKNKGVQIFPIKKEGLVKQEVVLKKGVSLIFMLASPLQCYLSLNVRCVYVLFIYTISISITCVSQENLVLQHLINRYITFTSKLF